MDIKQYLRYRGLTQKKFAEICGIEYGAMLSYCQGWRRPPREKALRIMQASNALIDMEGLYAEQYKIEKELKSKWSEHEKKIYDLHKSLSSLT